MKKNFLLVCIFLVCSLGQAISQNKIDFLEDSRYSIYKYLKDSSAIVVRIEDFKDAIEKSNDLGKNWLVEELTQKAIEEKEFMINSFTEHYDFSKFYFYNSSEAEKLIINGDLSVIYDKDGNSVNLDDVETLIFGHSLRAERNLKIFYRVMRFYCIRNSRLIDISESFGKEVKRNIMTNILHGTSNKNDILWMNETFHKKYKKLEAYYNKYNSDLPPQSKE